MILLCVGCVLLIVFPTPGRVMQDFHTGPRHESAMMDPLIVNAWMIKEPVLKELSMRDSPRRRYLIGFIGLKAYPEAAPGLVQIVRDEGEPEFIRAEALESLYCIDGMSARDLASLYRGKGDALGSAARDVLAGAIQPPKRSFMGALLAEKD